METSRFLMKIKLGADSADSRQSETLQALFQTIPTKASYMTQQNGTPIHWAVIEIADPEELLELARLVHGRVGAKPEFLAEVAPDPYFGRKG